MTRTTRSAAPSPDADAATATSSCTRRSSMPSDLIVTMVSPKGEKAGMILLSDGTQVWTPEYEKAKPLTGKAIPQDWTIKQGEYGPQAFPPRPKGGGMPPAYRNSKEGQAYEQERMDRRTALMQAVAATDIPSRILDLANDYYAWLRETAGSAATPVVPPTTTTADPAPQPAKSDRGLADDAGKQSRGQGSSMGK